MATKDPIILDSTGQEILTAIKDLKTSTGNDYKDLTNKPSVNSVELNGDLSLSDIGAQDKLVSAANIKTINGNSLLGAGNITILEGSSSWGKISGVLADQTDLSDKLTTLDNNISTVSESLNTKNISVNEETVVINW